MRIFKPSIAIAAQAIDKSFSQESTRTIKQTSA